MFDLSLQAASAKKKQEQKKPKPELVTNSLEENTKTWLLISIRNCTLVPS